MKIILGNQCVFFLMLTTAITNNLTIMQIQFSQRHIGPDGEQIKEMLSFLGFSSFDEFISEAIPSNIFSDFSDKYFEGINEVKALAELKKLGKCNKVFSSYIGQGYYNTHIPGVIRRNILENPGWYTQYTPYQAEISQGRLEALLNFQTMVSDLTSLAVANASLLDEATAAAEAMTMFFNSSKKVSKVNFFVSDKCHPQTIDVLRTRSHPMGIKLIVDNINHFNCDDNVFGILVQNPDTEGKISDFTHLCQNAQQNDIFVCIATDLQALTLLKSPGEMGADVAIGNTQRFGVPMGFGGPHAAFFATTEAFKRKIPGRIIGVSQDSNGNKALRMALQTREQHIRREKATSNICTAQVLLAIISSMYAVYHGPTGLKRIGQQINLLTHSLATSLEKHGYKILHKEFFDTICFKAQGWKERAKELKLNFRDFGDGRVGISLDETTTIDDVKAILKVFKAKFSQIENTAFSNDLLRSTNYMEHPIFNNYQSETKMLRYIHTLESKDLSLNTSMIPLGSCTMKLNSTAEMESVTWNEYANIHPFSPSDQVKGYTQLINELGDHLIHITGFDAISMQPNSGAQGEYAGLMIIRAYHQDRGDHDRNICLIPSSAHGTNPASAIMAGMRVVVVKCDKHGNIDEQDFKNKVDEHKDSLAAFMATYPSTHGVFEHTINDLCKYVHNFGGQVYLDGANLNALVGISKPGDFGADVMHINLHKTFCIPHGGGGPGMGPIVCKNHLAEFLPGHISLKNNNSKSISAVSAAPFGSSSILPISWTYIKMMGSKGLKHATEVAILNANYMFKKLENYYPVLFKGLSGYIAHEFIIDIRPIRESSGITEEDIAKRLMDYGFHAPTMSWPVPGTMMIEPTESESKDELDRFCDAMISIKNEIDEVEKGNIDRNNNPLKNAPHTAEYSLSEKWDHPYSRKDACFPGAWQKQYKYWPSVNRIDNAYGDRNLICSCPPIEKYS